MMRFRCGVVHEGGGRCSMVEEEEKMKNGGDEVL